ncbi:thioredoxin family protein [Amaricoccus sp.]|uniref:DUF1223 domain-containing protein n=1 Tax=Amaricoccus sp. TaxID=1872485 RepID=UPI001B76454C|nr:DUF1223 domain-containing protein [Amaricoccus sp.]MBP7001531.1 DUF1223 domain-containing protein [Amaricoccus sp.]
MRIFQPVLVVTALAAPALVPAATVAQETPVVVELYTSQGCSACPPADAILAELAQWPDVVALALHVDYWDYLGWKDSFGQTAHSLRQRAYARAAGKRSLYTPQMIVQGADRVGGADADRVAALIAEHRARPAEAKVDLTREGERLDVRITAANPVGVGPSEVYLVRYIDEANVAIEHGENAGYDIDYANVVTDWTSVGRWDGVTPIELDLPTPGPEPVAVIVQRDRLGPVVAAAKLP